MYGSSIAKHTAVRPCQHETLWENVPAHSIGTKQPAPFGKYIVCLIDGPLLLQSACGR